MSSTISTSRPSMATSRSLRIRTTPEESVADPYEATAMKSISQGDLVVDLAHQVGEEEDRALEDPDEQQRAAGVVAGDLFAQLRARGAPAAGP